MPKEREHKFLFKAKHFRCLFGTKEQPNVHSTILGVPKRIVQGYLSTKPTVRIRIVNDMGAFLTVKG
jgi:CYTH domain-containing protein